MTGLPEVKAAVAHTLHGERVDDFLPDAEALAQTQPAFTTVPGWSEPTSGLQTF